MREKQRLIVLHDVTIALNYMGTNHPMVKSLAGQFLFHSLIHKAMFCMSDDRTVYESHVHLRYVHRERERETWMSPPLVFNHRPKMHRTSLAYISGRHLLIWPISLVNFRATHFQPPTATRTSLVPIFPPRRGSDSRTYQMVSSGEEDEKTSSKFQRPFR